MINNKELWDAMKQPPPEALKKITGGRLSGMTDIKPQWRYEVITEMFGPCGVGWKFETTKVEFQPGADEQMAVFVDINFYYKFNDEWSAPIPGTGGSMFISKEQRGLYTSDEVIKMATTDALSVALKYLGVGADVYSGLWDGSKYKDTDKPVRQNEAYNKLPTKNTITTDPGFRKKYVPIATIEQLTEMYQKAEALEEPLTKGEVNQLCNWYKKDKKLTNEEAQFILDNLESVIDKYIDYLNKEVKQIDN